MDVNVNIIINILFITSCVAVLNWSLLHNNISLKKSGVNTLFIGFVVLAIRLCLPFSITLPVKLIIPFPYIMNLMNSVLRISVYKFELKFFLGTIWLTVSIVLFINYIYRYIKLMKLKKMLIEGSEKIEEIDIMFKQIKDNLGLKNNIILSTSDYIHQPFTFGIISPIVAIPNRRYDRRELEFILLHELNHIKSYDSCWKLLFSLFKIFYWWIPTVHILFKQLDIYLEIRCDNNCLANKTYDIKMDYLECLLKEVRYTTDHKNPIVMSMNNSRTNLEKRFEIILSDIRVQKSNKRYVKIIIVLLFIFSFSILLLPYSIH